MLSTRLCTGYSFFDGKAGFLYNGMVNIRLDLPCQREFSYFEIDFVGLAFEWPGTCGCESIRQKGLKNE